MNHYLVVPNDHTGKWAIMLDGSWLCELESESAANFLALAANCHDELVAFVTRMEAWDKNAGGGPSGEDLDWDTFDALMIEARTTLAKVRA